MGTGVVVCKTGKQIMLHRTFVNPPTYSIPSVFKLGTGTTTPLITDVDVETEIGAFGSKAFVAGYPTLDETNMISTIRCLVLTTEANGETITEFGVFNTDAVPKMLSHLVHTGIVKTSDVQIYYVEKDLIEL